MLQIHIPEREKFDEVNNEFITTKAQDLTLEHSLVSVSKWESKWCKPFLETKNKTPEELLDYIRCMTITQNVDPMIYFNIDSKTITEISEYINAPMTATWFAEEKKQNLNKEIVTSELIYYWMIALNIPVQFEKWHLNRLLTLIKVCNVKNAPPKKMTRREIFERNKALNEARKAKLHSNG